MKGLEPLIGAVLVIAISISAIALVLDLGKPGIDRQHEILLFESSKNMMNAIDNSIRDVASEFEGSSRQITLDIKEGFMMVSNNEITYEIETPIQIFNETESKMEGNLNVSGKAGGIILRLDYNDIYILGDYQIDSKTNLIVKNVGVSDGNVQIQVSPQGSDIIGPTDIVERLCGNGIVEVGEECDDGELNRLECEAGYGETCGYCSLECLTVEIVGPYCGDNNIDAGEQCDDGNLIECDACSSTCQYDLFGAPLPVCGNNFVECGEECDDGDDSYANDGCHECVVVPNIPVGDGRTSNRGAGSVLGLPGPVCGNRVCEPDESMFNCWSDCGPFGR